jgi:hypothetical protein
MAVNYIHERGSVDALVVDDDVGAGGGADEHIDVLHGDVVELGKGPVGASSGSEGVGFIEQEAVFWICGSILPAPYP